MLEYKDCPLLKRSANVSIDYFNKFFHLTFISGDRGGGMKDERREEGVPDMTVMSDINETQINNNLQIRYKNNNIYVSVYLF